MTDLADAVLRGSTAVACGLLACVVLRRQSAALRHAVLATSLLAAPAVTVMGWLLPPIEVDVPAAATLESFDAPAPTTAGGMADATASSPVVPPAAARTPRTAQADTLPTLVLAAWAAGAVVATATLLLPLLYLGLCSRRARPVRHSTWQRLLATTARDAGITRSIALKESPRSGLLATFGWRRPCVLVPRLALDWPESRVEAVLRHELAHVRRGDWALQLYADVVRALFWWHPLAWIASRRLAAESELACDDAVLAQGVKAETYAGHLISVARLFHGLPVTRAAAMPMARPSTLHRRIAAMLAPARRRAPLTRTALTSIAACALVVMLPLSVLRATQGAQPLEGAVYDPTGAVLPGVELTLTRGTTSASSTTDASGRFLFAAVEPGRYLLEARLAGFRALKQEVTLEQPADWDRAVTLQVGEVQETIMVRERRGTSTAQPAAGPQPIRVGGNIRPPRKLVDVRPVYPPAMREAGREGRVSIEAIISRDGKVTSARVTSTDVHPDFAIAAIDAVRQWQFEPTLLNGGPVDVVMAVSVSFSLE